MRIQTLLDGYPTQPQQPINQTNFATKPKDFNDIA
jgi:hypothetical protein